MFVICQARILHHKRLHSVTNRSKMLLINISTKWARNVKVRVVETSKCDLNLKSHAFSPFRYQIGCEFQLKYCCIHWSTDPVGVQETTFAIAMYSAWATMFFLGQSTEMIVFFGSVTTVANLVFIRFAFGNLFQFIWIRCIQTVGAHTLYGTIWPTINALASVRVCGETSPHVNYAFEWNNNNKLSSSRLHGAHIAHIARTHTHNTKYDTQAQRYIHAKGWTKWKRKRIECDAGSSNHFQQLYVFLCSMQSNHNSKWNKIKIYET